MAGAPVSRNAPCPCGSGRRYRECHGAIDASRPQPASLTTAAATYRPKGPDWDDVDPAERARLAALMDAALARQAANDQSGAARLYREVLAVAPQTHDALHMLAVAQWGLGDLDDAWRLIERASALRDPYPAIATNRETLQRARAHQARIDAERRAEGALPDLLTRLASRAHGGHGLASAGAGDPLHLIVGTGDPDDDVAWIATRLMQVLAPWDPTSWIVDGVALAGASNRVRVLRPERGEFPSGGVHVHVGVDLVDRMDWLARAAPSRVVAIGVRARAVDWLTGLSALARDGTIPLGAVFLTSAQAARFGAAGPVLPDLGAEALAPPRKDARGWTLGVVAGNGRTLETVPDGALLRRLAASGIAVAVRAPGYLRYQLGDAPGVRFEPRGAGSLEAFVASVDALLVPTRRWQNEGLEREIGLALSSGRPVVVRTSSIHAPDVQDVAVGRIVSGDDEAFHAIAALARAELQAEPRVRLSADEQLESARRVLGVALALGPRRIVH